MTTKRAAIRGVIFGWVTVVGQILIAFVATPIFIHELGIDRYGIWTIVMSFTAWYLLADFGLRGAAVKYISQHEALENHDAIDAVIVTSTGAYLAFSALLMAVGLVIAWLFPAFYETELVSTTTLRWVIIFATASVVINLLGQVFDASLVALRRFDLQNLGALGAQLVQACLIVYALKVGRGLLTMSVIVFLVAVGTLCFRFLMARRILHGISLRPKHFDRNLLWRLCHFGGLSSIQIIARQGATPASNILIAIALGTKAGPPNVTYFSIASMLSDYGARLATGVAGPLMPVASQLDTLGREKILRRAFVLGTKTLLAMGCIMATVLVAIGFPLIEFWIDDPTTLGGLTSSEFAGMTYPLLCILLPAYIFRMVGMGSRSILMGTNRIEFLGVVGLVEIVLTLGIGSVLLWSFKWPIGMAIGILVGQAVGGGFLIPLAAGRAVRITLGEFLAKVIGPVLTAIVPVIAVAYGVWLTNQYGGWLQAQNVYHIVVQALAIGCVGALCIFLICFDRPLRNDILQSFITKNFLLSSVGTRLRRLPGGQRFLEPLLHHTGRGDVPPEDDDDGSAAVATDGDRTAAATDSASSADASAEPKQGR
ncbi:MAG: hypothetical protein DWQ42_13175 [Planctomycetota bacterium]|nr:MAG: hypothetical protein DWQ42_13175 [Planctomycetota bacterium]REK40174.1 MAG: hypothetical protein DWQ46_17100 [Planctomycetota bacterium]